MEPIHRAILEELGTGKSKAQSRDQLRLRVGYWLDRDVPDRELREAIEWLRANDIAGAEIMSSSGWAGYWRLEDLSEFEDFYKEQRNRALSTMVGLRKQRDLLRLRVELPKQLELIA